MAGGQGGSVVSSALAANMLGEFPCHLTVSRIKSSDLLFVCVILDTVFSSLSYIIQLRQKLAAKLCWHVAFFLS